MRGVTTTNRPYSWVNGRYAALADLHRQLGKGYYRPIANIRTCPYYDARTKYVIAEFNSFVRQAINWVAPRSSYEFHTIREMLRQ